MKSPSLNGTIHRLNGAVNWRFCLRLRSVSSVVGINNHLRFNSVPQPPDPDSPTVTIITGDLR